MKRPADPLDARAQAVEAVERHRKELERLSKRKDVAPRDKSAVEAQLHSSLKLLAKIDGVGEVTVSQILRSAAWRRCSERILDVARAFPGCSEAMGKAMRELEGEGG